jgi:hypothetical protein
MKRFWGHVAAGLGFAGTAFVVFSACAHDDSSIFIRSVLAPPAAGATAGGGCLYTSDPNSAFQSSGSLDIAFSSSYEATLLIGNQLQARASTEQGRTETNRVTIQGVVVRVFDDQNHSLLAPFTRTASAFIDPSTGGQPAYSLVGATVLDNKVTDTLLPALQQRDNGRFKVIRVMAYIKTFGVTLGGVHVESNEIQYPIDICYGCLVSFPPGVSSPLYPQPNCASTGTGTTTGTALTPCILGQDQPVDCRLCSGRDICKPAPPSAADAGAADAGAVDSGAVDSGTPQPVDAGGGG